MRVAALYDIHANLPALEAVVAELADVDLVIVGGDVVWGPMPGETMDLIRSLSMPVEFLMGNADRDVFDRVEGNWKESNDWCADRLSDADLEFLRTRPATIAHDGNLFCHGSPRNDTDCLTIGTPEEQVREWCERVEERTIVCGHTHAQFDRTVGDLRLVNAGSVGQPFGDLGAYWAIFGPDVELRFTPYDVESAASAIRATGFPSAEMAAAVITSREEFPAQAAANRFG